MKYLRQKMAPQFNSSLRSKWHTEVCTEMKMGCVETHTLKITLTHCTKFVTSQNLTLLTNPQIYAYVSMKTKDVELSKGMSIMKVQIFLSKLVINGLVLATKVATRKLV